MMLPFTEVGDIGVLGVGRDSGAVFWTSWV